MTTSQSVPETSTATERGVEALPLNELETLVSNELSQHTTRVAVRYPETAEVYITGSYGGQEATADSDIDLTVGLLNTPEVDTIHPDGWIDLSHHLCEVLTPFHGYNLDVMIMPRQEWFFEHIDLRATHGGYDTVYDLYSREFRNVKAVCDVGRAAFSDTAN